MHTKDTAIDLKKQIADEQLRRYALSINANQEEMVVDHLKERIKKMSLEEDITDTYIPIVSEIITRKDKKILKPIKVYPGYMFVRMKMNDRIWYVVRNTPGVRLIIGAETRPTPLTDEEFAKIVHDVEAKNSKLTTRTRFQIGDVVTMKDTTFKGMKGVIREIDETRGSVVVIVEFMWKATPVTMTFDKVALAD